MQPELIGGRYRVQKAIGQGGMGTVWLCRDETLHRDVAVKQVGLLPGESVTDSARAFREARSSAGLSHRNVVTVFDVVEEAGAIWLVMEHVPGRSLSEIVKEDGPLSPAEASRIGAQVADGLAAAHRMGTMHRDVKPGNVLVREDGVAKISDFGIARTAGDPALTQSGFLTGTPSYFSPELARGGEPGPGTDVWALGATLYTAVEGNPPYAQKTNPVAVLHDITSGQPPRPARAEFLEPALLRMMDRNPDSRWSMADAAHALHRLADTHRADHTRENTVPPAPVTTPARAPVGEDNRAERPAPSLLPVEETPEEGGPRRRNRSAVYALLIAAALLLVLGGIAYAAAQRGDTPSAAGTAGGRSTASGSDTHSSSPARKNTPATKNSPARQSSAGAPHTASGPAQATGGGASAKEAFVRDYYATAPGGTDAAWAMLGPGEQDQGRGAYDGFWRTIRSVDVLSARARPGSDSVDVTLTYHTTDGRLSTERKREGLIRSSGGGYLLNSDVAAG